jgi:hypothetical protein
MEETTPSPIVLLFPLSTSKYLALVLCHRRALAQTCISLISLPLSTTNSRRLAASVSPLLNIARTKKPALRHLRRHALPANSTHRGGDGNSVAKKRLDAAGKRIYELPLYVGAFLLIRALHLIP